MTERSGTTIAERRESRCSPAFLFPTSQQNFSLKRFWINPKHLRFPLAVVTIVCCEIVAILVLGYFAI